ncbi:unnamed protein product [Vitrella brassicaformis CCMP3155]|uniref:Uncharacterized protein n=1 Tax=Vitrella brassicaformis (strain CCMP3155) TaxID=1169540 RepID=A0A0G4G522_VITBC|nr:unnamed protein product [Vitrella brassicaformis CCMP3155]|eukprot:CEM23306.1 unnamed protein product [Vitrella brassicaformis CCMP3155]
MEEEIQGIRAPLLQPPALSEHHQQQEQQPFTPPDIDMSPADRHSKETLTPLYRMLLRLGKALGRRLLLPWWPRGGRGRGTCGRCTRSCPCRRRRSTAAAAGEHEEEASDARRVKKQVYKAKVKSKGGAVLQT